MKIKPFFLGVALLLFFLQTGSAQALTPLRGSAFGQGIGRIHMDYSTALRPEDYTGLQENFYLSPVDPVFRGPGVDPFTAQIYDFTDQVGGTRQCNEEACPLTGFMWSDSIGWILLGGNQIQNALLNEEQFGENFFARIHMNGALSGMIWSETTGWIALSASPSGTTTPLESQNAENWGVYLDSTTPVETLESPDPEGEDLVLGRPLQGAAWSRNLGWIKFGSDADDSPNFGVFTNWVPDLSPPRLLGQNNAWFANNNSEGTLVWRGFAVDEESGIRQARDFFITRAPGADFLNCNEVTRPDAISYDISANELVIPSVGNIRNTPLGFCRYELSGTLINNAGFPFQIGGTPPADADESNYRTALTFSVRAGTVDESKTRLSPGASSAVADGSEALTFTLELFDVADNPIVPVVCGAPCGSRRVNIQGTFDQAMRYDTLQTGFTTSPVRVNGVFLEQQGEGILSPPEGLSPVGERYPLNITSFSPTFRSPLPPGTLMPNEIDLLNLRVEVIDTELSPVSLGLDRQAPNTFSRLIENLPINQVLTFLPALNALNGEVRTSGAIGQILADVPATLSFQLQNASPSRPIENIDIDTFFHYTGSGAELLSSHEIAHELSLDEIPGWSDPILLGDARYEVFSSPLLNGMTSVFRALTVLPDGTAYPSAVDESNGSYAISPPENRLPGDPERIDRSDALSFSLASGALSDPAHAIAFVPSVLPLPGIDLGNVGLTISQSLAYRFADQPEFTIFNSPALVTGISLQTGEGAGFKGMGVGKSIFDGDLEMIGPEGVRGLKEQIRRNVAELTQNRVPCSAPSAPLSALETSGPCVKADPRSGSLVAFYEASTPSELFILGDGGSGTITPPSDSRYTLILKGGMNLFIQNNVALPASPQSSLGFILLSESSQGGNVYLSPSITNMAGNLFAEGSLLSSPDGSRFYYGDLSPEPLSNQLFWQGSIASLNTLGGANTSLIPQGIACPTGLLPYPCSQRYDLNFLRRFSVLPDGSGISNNGLFSGGGRCLPGGCSLGPLPTIIELLPDNKIDRSDPNTLKAFFIEPLLRPAPPGFSVTTELESSQVIR